MSSVTYFPCVVTSESDRRTALVVVQTGSANSRKYEGLLVTSRLRAAEERRLGGITDEFVRRDLARVLGQAPSLAALEFSCVNVTEASTRALGEAIRENTSLVSLRVATLTHSLSRRAIYDLLRAIADSRAPLKHVYISGISLQRIVGDPDEGVEPGWLTTYVHKSQLPKLRFDAATVERLEAFLTASLPRCSRPASKLFGVFAGVSGISGGGGEHTLARHHRSGSMSNGVASTTSPRKPRAPSEVSVATATSPSKAASLVSATGAAAAATTTTSTRPSVVDEDDEDSPTSALARRVARFL